MELFGQLRPPILLKQPHPAQRAIVPSTGSGQALGLNVRIGVSPSKVPSLALPLEVLRTFAGRFVTSIRLASRPVGRLFASLAYDEASLARRSS